MAIAIVQKALPIVCAVLVPLGLSLGMFLAAREALIGAPPEDTLQKLAELAALRSVVGPAGLEPATRPL